MNVVAVQLDIAWHDKPANFAKVRALLERANPPVGSLIVLPEMFASGFTMDVAAACDEPALATEAFLHETSARYGSAVMGGVVRRAPDGRGQNQAVVVFPDGREPVRYQKVQTFTLAGETEHYQAGEEIVLFDWQGFTVAPFICYDLRFPELFRAAAARGAQVLTCIANWPIARDEHWTTLLRARAIENLCYVVGVNRCGRDPHFTYSGRSAILGPRGGEIAAAEAREHLFSARLALEPLLQWRREFPALDDMRREFAVRAPAEAHSV